MDQDNKKDRVIAILKKLPDATNKQLYNLLPDINQSSIRKYKADFLNKDNKTDSKKVAKTKKVKPKSFHSKASTLAFIDDPDELLLSTAIRELNKPNPDPRWATILINCKKENINTKEKVEEQFRQLTTQGLVNLLSKSYQEES
jgi:hypothetical protein